VPPAPPERPFPTGIVIGSLAVIAAIFSCLAVWRKRRRREASLVAATAAAYFEGLASRTE